MRNTETANKTLEKIAKTFSESKEIPKYMAATLIRAPEIPCSSWSFSNQMLMGNTNDARGYYQWQKVGRYVCKTKHARYILAPRPVIKEDEDGEKYEIIVGFKAVPVYAIEDTAGKELEVYKPKTIPPLANLAKISYKNSVRGSEGFFDIKTKEITLSSEDPAVFFHELVHKYDDKSYNFKEGEQNPEEEIVAELGSCVLAHLYNTKYSIDNHLSYIASYLGTKSPTVVGAACLRMADRTMKAINLILKDAAKLS